MNPMRNERPRGNRAAVPCDGYEAHLRNGLLRHVTEIHARTELQTNLLDACFQRRVGFELLRRFGAGDTEIFGAHHDDGHAVVDARHRNPIDRVDNRTGRQQRAAARTGDIEKFQRNRRGRAGHTVDAGVALVFDRATRGRHGRDCDAARVHHVDADGRRRARNGDQAVFDRPRADAGEDVAAVLAVADFGLVDDDLQKQIVDVSVVALRTRDDRNLAGERMRAADAVDLPHVGRAHRGEQHAIAQLAIVRQVLRMEIQALRGPAPHQRARDRGEHCGSVVL
jgi:hypothetical protein